MGRKEAFLELHQKLLRRLEALKRALAGDMASLGGSKEEPPGSFVDYVMRVTSEDINSQLAEVESQEIVRIQEALERMENGTYGICEDCKAKIKLVRLAVLPCATRCIECQREAEKEATTAKTAVS